MEYLILTIVALMSLVTGIAAGNYLKKYRGKNKDM